MFGAIAGGIASALAGGAMSKLFGGGQKAASGGIQGDVLATDNNTVGMGDVIGVFHNRRNASSRLLLLISKHLILCIYLVFRILACSRRLNASNLFLSLILHLGNPFLIVQLPFSTLFLIL